MPILQEELIVLKSKIWFRFSHHCLLVSVVAFVTTCNAHVHSAKGSNKGSKNFFLVKICFSLCIIINKSQIHPSEKNTNELTVRGGVNPYGQPDRKISVVFFDDFP